MAHRAGFWIRVLATAIDVVAMLILAGIAALAAAALTPDDASRAVLVAMYGVWLGYTTFEVWTAATPGKLLLGLRIVEQDCTPAGFWRRVLRWSTKQYWMIASLMFAMTESPLFYLVSGFSSLVTSIGCLYAANDDRLTWHDAWAHTAVCYRSRWSQAIVPPPLPPRPPAQSPPPNA